MTVYVGFSGTAHVLQGLACFLIEICSFAPQTLSQMTEQALATFEIEADLDLGSAIDLAVQQLRDLGILMPCPQPS